MSAVPPTSLPAALRAPVEVLPESAFRSVLRQGALFLAVVLAIPALALLALTAYLIQSAWEVERSDELISQVQLLQRLAIDIETGLRGFQVTGDALFLEPATTARQALPKQFERLDAFSRDNPEQTKLAEELRHRLVAWQAFAAQSLDRQQSGQLELVRSSAHQRAGKELMDAVREVAQQMVKREEAGRHDHQRAVAVLRVSLVSVVTLLSLFGIPLTVIFLGRLLQRLSSSYQASLQASEARTATLRVTLRSIGDAVIATDTNGHVDFLNPVAQQLTGWSEAAAVGQPLPAVFDIFNEQTRQLAENPVARVLRDRLVVGLANHTVLRSRTGEEFPIEDSAAPIFDQAGAVMGVILVFHSVSDRRAAEFELARSEKRLRLLNELGEIIRTVSEPEKAVAIACRLLARHLQVTECVFAKMLPDGDRFRFLGAPAAAEAPAPVDRLSSFGPEAGEALRAGRPLVLEEVGRQLSSPIGKETFQRLHAEAVICCPIVKAGVLRAWIAVAHDQPRSWNAAENSLVSEVGERCWSLLEQNRVARDLSLIEHRNRAILLTAIDGVILMDQQGLVVDWNPAAARIFGWSHAEIVGRSLADYIIPKALREAHARGLEKYLATGQGPVLGKRLELLAVRKDGSEFPIEININPLPDDSEKVFVGFLRDITEAKQAERSLRGAKEAAEAASRAKDNFLAALSHELRTPLTPVLMTAAALREDERVPADAREQLGVIERSVALEARLIDDLLDLTRIARGKLQLRPEHCDVHSLLGFAVEIVRDEAQARGQQLQFELTARRTGLVADPSRLQQVFWNLLRNAVKFTPQGGCIYLRSRDTKDGVLEIEVSDTGIGISPEALDLIFSPFEQAGLENDHRFGGLGLGLAIAHAIVASHGGQIRALSPGPGRGATFVVDLPGAIPPPHGLRPHRTDTPAEESPIDPLRILLLEDHEPTLQVLTRLLLRDGHYVVGVGTVAAGLAAAAAETFEVVISDLGLPDGTGFDVMTTLRDRHGLRGIALSGYGMEEDIRRSKQSGFFTHLVKPIEFSQLRRALAQLCATTQRPD